MRDAVRDDLMCSEVLYYVWSGTVGACGCFLGAAFVAWDLFHWSGCAAFPSSLAFGAVGHFSECEPLYVMFPGACC